MRFWNCYVLLVMRWNKKWKSAAGNKFENVSILKPFRCFLPKEKEREPQARLPLLGQAGANLLRREPAPCHTEDSEQSRTNQRERSRLRNARCCDS